MLPPVFVVRWNITMLTIKRYSNRKLYDTAAKQYISLERVTELIRSGEDIRVLDHVTGEDLTTLVLMQIIVEQEKRHSGFLPLDVLTGLVQAGGNTLAMLRRSLLAPLNLRRQVDEEIVRRVEKLVALGELAEGEGSRLSGRLLALGFDGAGAAPGGDDIERQLRGRGLATRADVQTLTELVDALSTEVDALVAQSRDAGFR